MGDAADAGQPALIELRDVVKHFQSLRPLRIRHLDIQRGHALALLGFDEPMAEVFVNLLTAASLPDEGDVRVFGEPTASVSSHQTWMALLDRFGLVSRRSVLLDRLTAEQNLAIPFTLAVESMSDDVRRDVRALADEVGIPSAHLTRPLVELPASSTMRLRLGRALALNPQVLLAEHPNAPLTPAEAAAFAADVTRIRRSRGIASVVLTADRRFASAIATDVLTLQPANGELKADSSGWKRWFR
jgi:ABC-type transporter Mla maintaining outer membrane lipid asymmetry ATPase subunit MlaF